MKLSSMLNSALVFAAKKDVRYYLNGLNIYHKNGFIKAIAATDGHCLQVLTNSTNVNELGELDSFIVPYDDCKRLVAIFSTEDINSVAIDEILKHVKPIDGRYPDVKRVIPDSKAIEINQMVMGINYKYLAKIGQSMTKLSKSIRLQSEGAVFTFYGADKAVKAEVKENICLDGIDVLFIVMPMRL